jgi:UDP-galactopyranose mutase
MKKYDYLIIGAGLFGSVFSHEALKKGKKCLIIESRNHIGGNIYTENIEGINVHIYGAHIFHTSNKKVWQYVNSFAEFNNYINAPIARYKDKIFNLPFNMNTFYQLWGVKTPQEAILKLDEQRAPYTSIQKPGNLEEQALVMYGKEIYEKLIKGYTEKQWGRPANKIPAFIIQRLPYRLTFDNNYFNDTFQGIPKGGYTKLVEALLKGNEVITGVNYFNNKLELDNSAEKIVYTGKIDEFFDYKFGKLDYRSLHFEHELLNIQNFQGNAVVNYVNSEVDFTRIIEHKHFEFGNQRKTYITKEYPHEFCKEKLPYYPVNDDKNQHIFTQYRNLKAGYPNVIFGGRLADYQYYDMHHIVANALEAAEKI